METLAIITSIISLAISVLAYRKNNCKKEVERLDSIENTLNNYELKSRRK